MRKGDMRAYFALNKLEKLEKGIDKSSLPVTIEFKPVDCSNARWLAILTQTQQERSNVRSQNQD